MVFYITSGFCAFSSSKLFSFAFARFYSNISLEIAFLGIGLAAAILALSIECYNAPGLCAFFNCSIELGCFFNSPSAVFVLGVADM